MREGGRGLEEEGWSRRGEGGREEAGADVVREGGAWGRRAGGGERDNMM